MITFFRRFFFGVKLVGSYLFIFTLLTAIGIRNRLWMPEGMPGKCPDKK
jgi:hypothetical protein